MLRQTLHFNLPTQSLLLFPISNYRTCDEVREKHAGFDISGRIHVDFNLVLVDKSLHLFTPLHFTSPHSALLADVEAAGEH